jgi:subtilase family serine protease
MLENRKVVPVRITNPAPRKEDKLMKTRNRLLGLSSGFALLAILALASSAFAAGGRTLPTSTPAAVTSAQNLGPESTSKVINMTLWLEVRNQAALDALTRQMYSKGSPNYHQFLTLDQYKSQFGPTDQAVQTVKDFAASQGLRVNSVSKSNLAVQVSGTVGQAQNAFHVQINRYQQNGTSFFAPVGTPTISHPAAAYIASVTGLHSLGARPTAVQPIDPSTGQTLAGHTLTKQDLAKHAPSVLSKPVVRTPGIFFEDQCWRGLQTQAFTTNGLLRAGVYSGNRYGSDPGSGLGHLPPCGYEPLAALTAYQMIPLFQALGADLATFSLLFGLPAPNLTIYQPEGPPPDNSGWGGEESIDLQWGHTMAPEANLALVEGIDNSFNSLNNALLFAIEAGLGNVISNSYGAPEALVDTSDLNTMNSICQLGASLGMSVDFSSGDSGDFVASDGVKTVSFGADSPYATGVGGVSVFLNPDDSIKFQTGWGTQLTRLANPNNTPVIPPLHQGFIYGAGGGVSGYFPKPSFQSALAGSGRFVPDIALIGDPYTGVEIIFSPCGDTSCQSVEVFGGTSVACPMFSGLWTDVDQVTEVFFGSPAGQAAPYTYVLPAGSLYDVINLKSATNVAGSTFTGGPPQYQDPTLLMTPLDGVTKFVTAFYHSPSSLRWYDEAYGMDSSLDAARGWDNVTGNGTPNGINFVVGVLSVLP